MGRRERKGKECNLYAVDQDGDEYTAEELEFLKAMERYKRECRRPFPTLHEVLKVLKSLGYRRVEGESGGP